MTSRRRVRVGLVATLSSLAVLVAATGWIHVLRPIASDWPGPRVVDALPLDELAGRAAVPLLLFVVVWAIAAALLGIARLAGLERLSAALALALGVGLWAYAVESISLFIVRGTAYRETLVGAARLQAVYLPAAFAGAAGALVAPSRARVRALTPTIMSVAVAVGGLVNVISAVTPELKERLATVEAIVPSGLSVLASAALAAVGVVLLLIARGLARRKRRAWQIAVGLLAGSSLLHLLKGLDYQESIVTGLLALTLLARRSDFDAPGDPTAPPRVALRVVAFVTAIYAYAVVALLINTAQADQPFSLGFALLETTRALFGQTVGGSSHIAGRFGRWWPLSVFLLAVVGGGSVVTAWLAPWRYRLRQEAQQRDLARSIVARWGYDTLAPFALRADKTFFFDPAERAFLAYRVVAGVALVSGDPVGPVEALPSLLAGFVRFARERGWRVATSARPNAGSTCIEPRDSTPCIGVTRR
jgi:lysyl-tRNA synthetase, class II